MIVDEATQATEGEFLIPFMRAEHKVILAGDLKQLGPTIKHRKGKETLNLKSAFERLIDGDKSHRKELIKLIKTYRLLPVIVYFLSLKRYKGEIENGVTEGSRIEKSPALDWKRNVPLLMYNVKAKENRGKGKTGGCEAVCLHEFCHCLWRQRPRG